MTRKTLDEFGLDLIQWYQNHQDHGTWLSDSRIGHQLGWFKGGRDRPLRAETLSDELRQVDVALVRKVRRHVDRDEGLFAGYWFGTKRNGAGVRWSHLNSPELDSPDDAIDAAVAEQFARLRQADQQFGVELERNIGKLKALQEDYIEKGKLDHAFVCHDAIRELQNDRQISLATIDAARRLGIPVPSGRFTA